MSIVKYGNMPAGDISIYKGLFKKEPVGDFYFEIHAIDPCTGYTEKTDLVYTLAGWVRRRTPFYEHQRRDDERD